MDQALNECELPTVFYSTSHNHQSIDQFAGLHLPDGSQLKFWLTDHKTPLFIAKKIKRQYLLMREALNAKQVAGSLLLLSFSAKSSDDDILYLKLSLIHISEPTRPY